MMLRLDEQLGRFLASLDAKVGAGKWAMIVTSDHGASPLPERVRGGRMTFESLKDAANRAASTELGAGAWIASAKYPTVVLNAAARARPAKDLALVFKKILLALRSYPGIERAGRTADFAGHCDKRTGDALAICLMLDPERSGELFYLPRAGWIMEGELDRHATAHGSLNAYDREVPVLVAAPGRHVHAPLAQPDAPTISMVRIAPMLAHWLSVTPPGALPRIPEPISPPVPVPVPAP
jgi:arylsulfatase A-like enzyme